jgi:alkylated DNA nucleotide flippase Atl1
MSTNPEHEAIYEAVRQIPAGSVITYGDLAEQVGLTRSHARHVGNVLGNRPDNNAWMTTPAEDHDVPWWRVVKADGTLLANQDDETGHTRQWIDWAKAVLISEGVAFTDDGRVASLAAARRHPSGANGARSSTTKHREPSPCWKHEQVQFSCRDCAPGR